MVTVKKISWISELAEEALVTITDGVYEIMCFSQPCELKLNQELSGCIHCYDNEVVYKSFDDKCLVNKHKVDFAYDMVACVEDVSNSIVKIGDIKMEMECYLPRDIKNGDYISFYVGRIDIY